jgi:hypothetical protein
VVVALLSLLVAALVLSPFALVLALQAQRRGFGFGVWLLAGFLSANPLLPLVLLGLLPNRARQAQRRAELHELNGRLARGAATGQAATDAILLEEVPPATTQPLTPGEPRPERSLGDQETQA